MPDGWLQLIRGPRPKSSDEIGGSNGRVGRIRPHVHLASSRTFKPSRHTHTRIEVVIRSGAHGGNHWRDDAVRKESLLGKVIHARCGLRGMRLSPRSPSQVMEMGKIIECSELRKWSGILGVRLSTRGRRSQHGVGSDHAVVPENEGHTS